MQLEDFDQFFAIVNVGINRQVSSFFFFLKSKDNVAIFRLSNYVSALAEVSTLCIVAKPLHAFCDT